MCGVIYCCAVKTIDCTAGPAAEVGGFNPHDGDVEELLLRHLCDSGMDFRYEFASERHVHINSSHEAADTSSKSQTSQSHPRCAESMPADV